MTETEKHAKSLIEQFGVERALAHVNFVLDPKFGLSKTWQIAYWYSVRLHIKAVIGPGEIRYFPQKIAQK